MEIAPHPLLDAAVVDCTLPGPLGELSSSPALLSGLSTTYEASLVTNDEVKAAVRKLLRHGGFKPSGRNKPASEYLIKASDNGFLSGINLLVDVCNVVSLHSGLPISVVDTGRTEGDLAIGIAEGSYVFNATGQELKLDGLLCVRDGQGWCANAVKDSQRTKTHDGTVNARYVIWGTNALPGRTSEAATWLATLLRQAGATAKRAL